MFRKINQKFTYRVSVIYTILIVVLSLSVIAWTAFYTSKVVYGSYDKTLNMLFSNKARDVRELLERTDLALELLLDDESGFVDKITEKKQDYVERIHLYTDARNMFLNNLSISLNSVTQNYKAALFLNENIGIYEVCPNEQVNMNGNIPNGIFRIDSVKDSEQYRQAIVSKGEMAWFKGADEDSVYAVKEVLKYRLIGGTAEIVDVGMVYISFDIADLKAGLMDNELTKNALISIENNEHEIIYSNTSNKIDFLRCAYYEYSVSNSLTMKVYIPKSDVNGVTNNYIAMSALIICVFLFVGIGIVILISKNITEPIVILSNHMIQNDTLTEISIDNERADEVGNIYKNYNVMVNKINQMIAELKASALNQKKMELRLMQLQINPHFIYNSLDNVNCRLMMMGEFDVANKISDLVNYMRYNMKNPDKASTLQKEIEMIESYMHVLELQYEDRIKLTVEIPEQFMPCSIPKMLLQPLVENAVMHGIENVDPDDVLIITIKAVQKGTDLIITVTDTGICGNIDMINRHIKGEINISKNRGYGIRNVSERLKMIYGDGYDLSYRTDDEGHTQACFGIKYEIADTARGENDEK